MTKFDWFTVVVVLLVIGGLLMTNDAPTSVKEHRLIIGEDAVVRQTHGSGLIIVVLEPRGRVFAPDDRVWFTLQGVDYKATVEDVDKMPEYEPVILEVELIKS